MVKAIIGIAVCVLFSALSLPAQQEQIFKGACVKVGAQYVLSSPDGKTVYKLDDQVKPEAFAGRSVVVVGTLDKATGTIHVSDMRRAMASKITQAKSVYIDCDACVREMAKASLAALQELQDWKRFDVLPDRRKADLIFLFSANPYLGDYVTRDGPDARSVSVNITFMNVLDPATGASLWAGCRRWGSWRVADATKDLIVEFRGQLAAGLSSDETQSCPVFGNEGK